MGTGRRHKTLGSETQCFITQSNNRNQSITFSCSHILSSIFHRAIGRWQGMRSVYAMGYVTGEETGIFYDSVSKLFLDGDVLSSKVIH